MASDNLVGISEAIKAAFPKTIIQKCIVHQIRNSMRHVRHDDLKEFVKDMKLIYQASSFNNAKIGLDKFVAKWQSKYGYATKSWQVNFSELFSYFDFPKEIRSIIYTTNPIENLDRTIRKYTKNKGSFPSISSLEKSVYLSIIEASKKVNYAS